MGVDGGRLPAMPPAMPPAMLWKAWQGLFRGLRGLKPVFGKPLSPHSKTTMTVINLSLRVTPVMLLLLIDVVSNVVLVTFTLPSSP